MKRVLLMALMLALLALPLVGCGKKGDPEAPGTDRYGKQYPAG